MAAEGKYFKDGSASIADGRISLTGREHNVDDKMARKQKDFSEVRSSRINLVRDQLIL